VGLRGGGGGGVQAMWLVSGMIPASWG
jgi:hypothetical protein